MNVDPLRCRYSGTVPDPAEYVYGYYNDGGFHHCHCGAVVYWENGVVADHHDQFLMAAVTRFRGMQRSEVEALLWMATDETEEPQP